LNEPKDASEWLGKGGAKAKLDNEKPQGETVNYEDLVARWNSN
jgi:glycerol transport system substrate-binding protein